MPHASATPARKHRSPAQWAALLSRFERSGQSVSAFCAQESISVAHFYRQRGLHRGAVPDEAAGSDTPCFVDLGALRAGAGTRFEIKLELGADRVQGRVMSISGTARGLAVNRDDASHRASDMADPTPKAGLEHLGVEQPEDATERVVRSGPVLENQVALEPRLVILGPFGHIHPAIGTAQHCTQRDEDHLGQIMPLRRTRTRIR